MDRMHNSQGLLDAPIRKVSELFPTSSRLTGLQGPICTDGGSVCVVTGMCSCNLSVGIKFHNCRGVTFGSFES
jgi:hypothetical protein